MHAALLLLLKFSSVSNVKEDEGKLKYTDIILNISTVLSDKLAFIH